MLISEALALAKNNLKQKLEPRGVNSYQIDALLILCHCLSISKEQAIFNSDIKLTNEEQSRFIALLARRENFEPISHILGKREFFGADFLVSSDVLDPRPDSESLIELVLENFCDKNSSLKILELGVGSACLIATILKYFPNFSGIGVDISDNALQIAQNNIDLLQVSSRVKLMKSNWFSNLSVDEKFDLIISNPPYIKTSDINFLAAEVKNFEPRLALDGGENGLDCYVKIAGDVAKFLTPTGFLILEIGQNQEEDVVGIFEKSGLELVKYKKDLSGIIRCLLFKIGLAQNLPITCDTKCDSLKRIKN